MSPNLSKVSKKSKATTFKETVPKYFLCIEIISVKGIPHEFDQRIIFAVTNSSEAAIRACMKRCGSHTSNNYERQE